MVNIGHPARHHLTPLPRRVYQSGGLASKARSTGSQETWVLTLVCSFIQSANILLSICSVPALFWEFSDETAQIRGLLAWSFIVLCFYNKHLPNSTY